MLLVDDNDLILLQRDFVVLFAAGIRCVVVQDDGFLSFLVDVLLVFVVMVVDPLLVRLVVNRLGR